MVGERSPFWKGDKAKYVAKHNWIRRKYGTPNKCEDCKKTMAKRFEWANISGKHFRDIFDYKRLCPKCHRKFDSNLLARGEKQGNSKLKSKDVIKIRKLYIPKKYNMTRLGKEFNVDKTTIRRIIRKINWKHIKSDYLTMNKKNATKHPNPRRP